MSSKKPPPQSQQSPSSTTKSALQSEVEKLHAEMEIADYGINEHTGRSRRKPTRKVQKVRTIKRKSLEKEDVQHSAVIAETGAKRLRGSKAAFEDEIVHGSLIFGGANDRSNDGDANDGSDEEHIDRENDNGVVDEEGRYELYQDELRALVDGDDDGFNEEHSVHNSDDNSDDNEEEDDEGQLEEEQDPAFDESRSKKRRRTRAKPPITMNPELAAKIEEAKKRFPQQKKIARTMYRLRNFKSHRMAEKHGDALGRHARGMNQSAVKKLKEVASAAPIAPQVYSSLGLVYESMLADEIKKCEHPTSNESAEDQMDQNHQQREEMKDGEVNVSEEDASLKEAKSINACIELAEKTFGSYHVAALLCKLDYTLWLRAGDAAMKLADLHKRCLKLPAVIDDETDENANSNTAVTSTNDGDGDGDGDGDDDDKEIAHKESEKSKQFVNPEEYMEYHRARKMKWLEEAKNDYLAADNINPPGISVPCKLANAHIQLGNLSEALTILTDMKNNSFQANFTEKNESLRPRSELERSYTAWLLYADLMLTVGFECSKWNNGDESNNNYMFRRWLRKYSKTFDWKERRLQSLCLALEAAVGTKCCEEMISWMQRRAHSTKKSDDTYELDQQIEAPKNAPEVDGEASKEKINKDTTSKSDESSITNLSLDELFHTFNKNREDLIASNRREIKQFDEETRKMNIDAESDMDIKRAQERESLINEHRSMVMNLAVQYRTEKEKIEFLLKEKIHEAKGGQPISISASCTSVFDIASQLMKLCIGMKIYSLGTFVARAVSLYLQERTLRSAARRSNIMAFNQRQLAASTNILQLTKEVYDDVSCYNLYMI